MNIKEFKEKVRSCFDEIKDEDVNIVNIKIEKFFILIALSKKELSYQTEFNKQVNLVKHKDVLFYVLNNIFDDTNNATKENFENIFYYFNLLTNPSNKILKIENWIRLNFYNTDSNYENLVNLLIGTKKFTYNRKNLLTEILASRLSNDQEKFIRFLELVGIELNLKELCENQYFTENPNIIKSFRDNNKDEVDEYLTKRTNSKFRCIAERLFSEHLSDSRGHVIQYFSNDYVTFLSYLFDIYKDNIRTEKLEPSLRIIPVKVLPELIHRSFNLKDENYYENISVRLKCSNTQNMSIFCYLVYKNNFESVKLLLENFKDQINIEK